MKNNRLVTYLLRLIIALFIPALVQAGTPMFTFTPLTATTIQVSTGITVEVQYQVENQSTRPHTLMMVPITGITQTTSAGNCPNPFVLGPKQACTLTLLVNGTQVPGNVKKGPEVCQRGPNGSPSPFLCYQPSAANSLNITVIHHFYAGAANGNVYYSINNGLNWQATASAPAAGSAVNSVYLATRAVTSTLYAGTQNGNVYYSTNNGSSWVQTTSPDSSAVESVFVIANTLYAGTLNGNVYYSTNNGSTWTATPTSPGTGAVNAVFVTTTALYAGSADGNVYYSMDNGGSWNAVSGPPDGSAIDSVFVANSTLYAGTADEYVYTITAASGGVWATYAQTVYSLFVNADGSIIDAGTQGGYIFSLINGSELGFVTNSPINSVYID